MTHRAIRCRALLVACGIVAALWTPALHAEQKPLWEFGLGVGGLVFPDYRGSDAMFERREYIAGSSAIHSKLQKLVAGALR